MATQEITQLSRRTLIKGLGAGIALVSTTVVGLSGCASDDATSNEGEILPLGSVVQLSECEGTNVMFMIIARRPLATKQRHYNENGEIEETSDDHIYDYAGVFWPYGIGTDFSQKPFDGEVWIFDAEAIASVIFRGYEDDLEKKAAALIKEAGEDQSCAVILGDMLVNDIYKTDPVFTDYLAQQEKD